MNATESKSLQDIIEDAIVDLNERLEESPDTDDQSSHDMIHEVADGGVPIYNAEILEVAAESPSIANAVPECGPAFDGTATPTNIAAANIYEAIQEALWERWREYEEERKEAVA